VFPAYIQMLPSASRKHPTKQKTKRRLKSFKTSDSERTVSVESSIAVPVMRGLRAAGRFGGSGMDKPITPTAWQGG
jgi:hypothetical protein